ncbi:MAG: hypothetical protein V1763_02600 [Parcubacteria group bacterium]
MKIDAAKSAIVAVDYQRAFTTEGDFGKAFEKEDVQPIDDALLRGAEFMRGPGVSIATRIKISAVYEPGQFTNGDLQAPLAQLCVPGSDGVNDFIEFPGEWDSVTKSTPDATREEPFRDWLQQKVVDAGIKTLYVMGCTITTCLGETAAGIRRTLPGEISIILAKDLAGGRRGHYLQDPVTGKSRADRVFDYLQASGITVIDSLEDEAEQPVEAKNT